MQFHAFYSYKLAKISEKIAYEKLKKYPCIDYQIITQLYKQIDTDKIVETTCLFRLDEYPKIQDCIIYYDDYIYLGIVYEMIGIGIYI